MANWGELVLHGTPSPVVKGYDDEKRQNNTAARACEYRCELISCPLGSLVDRLEITVDWNIRQFSSDFRVLASEAGNISKHPRADVHVIRSAFGIAFRLKRNAAEIICHALDEGARCSDSYRSQKLATEEGFKSEEWHVTEIPGAAASSEFSSNGKATRCTTLAHRKS